MKMKGSEIMKLNKSGFTLVELLAAMLILGILMGVAIPNVIGVVNRQKNNTYIEDAKRMAIRARTTFASNTNIDKESATCFTLKFLDNGDFDEPPNGGVYLKTLSYVRYGTDGKYYVTLIECVNCKEKTTEQIYSTSLSGKEIRMIYNIKYDDLITEDNPTKNIKTSSSGYIAPTNSASGCAADKYHNDENEEDD